MKLHFFGREIYIHKGLAILGILLFLGIAGGAGVLVSRSDTGIIVRTARQNTGAAVEKKTENTGAAAVIKAVDQATLKENEKTEEIKVYITGCVKKPGIVTIRKGQLIDDAIKSAGGLTAEADPESVNLVFKLEENVMLQVRSRQETQAAVDGQEAGKGVKVVRDSGGAIVNSGTEVQGKGGKVNINTASESELDTLPGIGEATARDIVAYRKSSGPFKTIQDIMKVPRIKESRFNSIKDLITV